MTRFLILTNTRWSDFLRRTVGQADANCEVAFSKEEISAHIGQSPFDFLISFASGVIVPAPVLDAFPGRAFNIHPASPDYPGSFPHHFAKFDGVTRYGATAHVMTERVDEGDIVDVELLDVDPTITPKALMDLAEDAGCVLFERLIKTLSSGDRPNPIDVQWQGPKRNSRDFQALCRISPLDSAELVQRKLEAVTVEGYQNAYIDLHGQRFVHQGPVDRSIAEAHKKRWSQFTEEGYRDLLKLAKANYRFSDFSTGGDDKHLIWRHDLDHSIERAHRIARIEHEHGVTATYMIVISLPYYNVFDVGVRRMAKDIAAMGHSIGLHFNASAYGDKQWSLPDLEAAMAKERTLLGQLLEVPVDSVSFHDPMSGNLSEFEQTTLAGMVNAYSAELKAAYRYCSDSNGYWRHAPISSILTAAEHDRLQVLTHPEWWTEQAMPPRNRIEQAILDRARGTMEFYDGHLARSNRENLDK